MLLTKMANREVYDFLRSVTIKNAYFAEQFKKSMVNYFYRNLLPEDRNPYYLHLLGNYILKKTWTGTVTDPATGDSYELTYPSSFVLESPDGRNLQTVRNSDVYTADALDEMIVITSLDTGKRFLLHEKCFMEIRPIQDAIHIRKHLNRIKSIRPFSTGCVKSIRRKST